MLGTVARPRRYPVKSMLGEDVAAGAYAEVLAPGRIQVGDPVRPA